MSKIGQMDVNKGLVGGWGYCAPKFIIYKAEIWHADC